jgi:hypothetical protein
VLCISYYACVLSSTKSVIRTEQDLPETEEERGGRLGKGVEGGERTQTMYANVNK